MLKLSSKMCEPRETSLFVKMMFVILLILCITRKVQCQECGTVSPVGKEVPWQAGIYRRNTDAPFFIWHCGGSLISNSVVVTAAHFLWIPMSSNVRVIKPSSIVVAVGKLSRPWTDPVDANTQKSNVKEIRLSPGFRQQGSGAIPYFFDDIAVVIVTEPFRFNDYIRPVCIDFDYEFEQQHLKDMNKGKAAGWGDPDQENPGQYVKSLYTVNVETCAADKATNTFYQNSKLFTLAISDKICVDAKEPNSAVCNGDSGIGLAFPTTMKGVERYYLRGVLSGSVDATHTCTINTYYGFTSLRKHESFIRKYWNESVPEVPKQIGKCVLPPYPEHGTYTTNATNVAVGGDEDFVVVTLTVTCDKGFGVMGTSSATCYNGFWPNNLPSCVLMCQLNQHPSVEYRCLVSGNDVGTRDCSSHEPVGTIVSPRCREPDFYAPTNLAFMRCKDDGHWDYLARCTPECGKVTPDGKVLVFGGTTVKRGELPWHVGIYKKTTTPFKQICGGSLISNNLIISAAHCFWTVLEQTLPTSQFAVAVGKVHRPWNDKMDEPQKSDVQEIHIPKRYQGVSASFQDDIAVVTVVKAFVYNTYVRPVCLSFDAIFDRLQLQTTNKGKVAGWGLTAANGKASPLLLVLEMPYVEVGTCIANSPPDFVAFITSDKICAGVRQNTSALCKGDSGGGLSFPATDRGVERHYLRGVVSSAPSSSDACNTNTYTSFTQIFKHADFIKPFLTEL